MLLTSLEEILDTYDRAKGLGRSICFFRRYHPAIQELRTLFHKINNQLQKNYGINDKNYTNYQKYDYYTEAKKSYHVDDKQVLECFANDNVPQPKNGATQAAFKSIVAKIQAQGKNVVMVRDSNAPKLPPFEFKL